MFFEGKLFNVDLFNNIKLKNLCKAISNTVLKTHAVDENQDHM